MDGLERILGKDACLTKEVGQSLVAGEVMREDTNRRSRFDVRTRVVDEQSFPCLNPGAGQRGAEIVGGRLCSLEFARVGHRIEVMRELERLKIGGESCGGIRCQDQPEVWTT